MTEPVRKAQCGLNLSNIPLELHVELFEWFAVWIS